MNVNILVVHNPFRADVRVRFVRYEKHVSESHILTDPDVVYQIALPLHADIE